MYKETEILRELATRITMNDAAITALLLTYDNPIRAFETLMALVTTGIVIMSQNVDATDRVIGGVYSLPSAQRAKYL